MEIACIGCYQWETGLARVIYVGSNPTTNASI